MQINEPVAEQSASACVEAGEVPGRSRRRRPKVGHMKSARVWFTPEERAEVERAAALAAMSTSLFCAEAALAAARGTGHGLHEAQKREGLARLQRQLFAARIEVNLFAASVNQALAKLRWTGGCGDPAGP
jgi:hypothetical protein